MSTTTTEPGGSLETVGAQPLVELRALRQFGGAAKDFWPRLLGAAGQLAGADFALLLISRPGQTPRWLKIGEWSAGAPPTRARAVFTARLEELAERALEEGTLLEGDEQTPGAWAVGVRLRLLRAEDEAVLLVHLLGSERGEAHEAQVRLGLAADTPALYQASLASRQAQADVEKFAVVLDTMVSVNAEDRFLGALLALANGVASRFRSDRVSLGWKHGGYMRLQAISRTEKFDRQMAAARSLENAMDECADQNEELGWPRLDESTAVTRDLEKYALEQKVPHLCALPLRTEKEVLGVLLCERAAEPYTALELQQLRLLADQATPRLAGLQRTDRWFGARWAAEWRRHAAKLAGPEHTWAKTLGALGVLLLLVLFLVPVSYRVEGTFILRSQEAAYLTAPFDGFIQKVFVRPGDRVGRGQDIVALNQSELLLDESAASAELGRYEREAEKARAARQLAEMRINDALSAQARAKLQLVNYRLQNATLRAPIDSVVVEGDLRERIASPVKQGEALYKLARLDGLYVEAEVPERDITGILQSQEAYIAFVTQPNKTFRARVETIEPAAVPKKEANVFLVRLRLEDAVQDWWRPGMTGLCKISAGRRTLAWIFTHRTLDFLRLKLWW